LTSCKALGDAFIPMNQPFDKLRDRKIFLPIKPFDKLREHH
jgi:hypothetical protein